MKAVLRIGTWYRSKRPRVESRADTLFRQGPFLFISSIQLALVLPHRKITEGLAFITQNDRVAAMEIMARG